MYSKLIKRILDIISSLVLLIILSPLILFLSIVGTVLMKGNPLFIQVRPGKNEKLFKMIKFRTMTNQTDKKGNLLSDETRLNSYGKFLRSTSLDELPELINILSGDMSFIGPRPQLVRDMVFMNDEQKKRHSVRQGLTGLAQISGRNSITWEDKLKYDLRYIENITFIGDIKILLWTGIKVLKREDVVREGTCSDIDFGDYLLKNGAIEQNTYDEFQIIAKELLEV